MTEGIEKSTGMALTETQEANVQQLVEAGNQMSIANAAVMSSFDGIKMLGQMEAMQFIATVAEKSQVEIFLHFKEAKKYKGLPYKRADGSTATIADLEEFCQVFLRKSNRRLQELVSNYNTIGADLYEQSERLGFRQRDYNALKALPADDRAIIAQAIEAEDLDKALDLMQQLAAKHQREKEYTEKLLDNQAKTIEAKDGVIKEKTEELNKKSEKINLLEAAKRTEISEVYMPGHVQLTALQDYTRRLTSMVTATFNAEIIKLYNEFDGQPPKHIELAARQAVGLIVTAAYGVADNMGFEPILDLEQAADEPGRADAKAFEEYMAAEQAQHAIDTEEFNRSFLETAELQGKNTTAHPVAGE